MLIDLLCNILNIYNVNKQTRFFFSAEKSRAAVDSITSRVDIKEISKTYCKDYDITQQHHHHGKATFVVAVDKEGMHSVAAVRTSLN